MVRLGQDMLDLKLNMYATSIKPDSMNHTQQISQICKNMQISAFSESWCLSGLFIFS